MERKDALAAGLTRYNTGRSCKNGHQADRFTVSGGCCECLSLTAAWHRENVRKTRINHSITFRGTAEQIDAVCKVWMLLSGEDAQRKPELPVMPAPHSYDPDKMYPILTRFHGSSAALQMIREKLGHDYVPLTYIDDDMGSLVRNALADVKPLTLRNGEPVFRKS